MRLGDRRADRAEPDEADRPALARHGSASAALRCSLLDPPDRLLGDAERLHRRGDAAVDRRLQQGLLDLLDGATVPDRAADVHRELVRAVERGQHPEIDQAAVTPLEPGPRPDGAPAVLGHELLHRLRELTRVGQRSLDVLRAEHLAPHGTSAFVHVVGHRISCSSLRGRVDKPMRSSDSAASIMTGVGS